MAVWSLALLSAAICGCAWIISSRVYVIDLLVSQQIWLAWWPVLMLAFTLGFRRWRLACILAPLCLIAFYPLCWGRTLMLPEVDFRSKREDVVRVISCNINPKSLQWEAAVEDLFELDADVIVLLEVPPDLTRLIRRQGWIGNAEYAHWAQRLWVDGETSPGYVLSRWPIERLSPETGTESEQHLLHVRIDHPNGAFIAALMHPFSPRDHDRWSYGNRVTRLQTLGAEWTRAQTELPMVFGVDLNAGIAQARARTLRAAGMKPSKPFARFGGTFPVDQGVPDLFTVQIDDVWTLGPVQVDTWSSIEVLGSDHRAVVVELMLADD
jgi:endonuclease/exonuclease/phosphatase (EEP) superfamily protein YafD